MMLTGGDFGNYQLVANFGAGIGYAGLLAALVARQKVLALIFVAVVFGSLRTGSGFLRSTGLSSRIADVVQGLLVLSLLLPPAIIFVTSRRRALSAAKART
jgi:simple sugar transport system permease protein